ncbi:hypothetical protein [Streptomyces sp. NPDC056061]|uniref:hypothetical protein n=1 Tax=Streptomyces sp. NPDC056061 TaxID=3345700 RepID=UPI0035E2D605
MSLYTSEREKRVERYLLTRCRELGLLCMKFTSPARGGVPDRIVVSHSGTVFVEVKRPGGILEPRQRAVHAKLRRFGAVVYVVDDESSVDALTNRLAGGGRRGPATAEGSTMTVADAAAATTTVTGQQQCETTDSGASRQEHTAAGDTDQSQPR